MNLSKLWKWLARIAYVIDKADDIIRAVRGWFEKEEGDDGKGR